MVEFYLLTFPRFPLRKKEHKSYFGKNRTHDFRTTSRRAAYLLDHSGVECAIKMVRRSTSSKRVKIFPKVHEPRSYARSLVLYLLLESLPHEQTGRGRFIPRQEIEANRVDVKETRSTVSHPRDRQGVHAPLSPTPYPGVKLAAVV